MNEFKDKKKHPSEIEYDIKKELPILKAYYATNGFKFIPVPEEKFEEQMKELYDYHQEIIFLCKKHRIGKGLIEVLETFFSLEDEKGPFRAPSEKMLIYHKALTLEIHRVLTSKSDISYELELLKSFIIFDFNKYSVRLYYLDLGALMRKAGMQPDRTLSEFVHYILYIYDTSKYTYSPYNKKLDNGMFTYL